MQNARERLEALLAERIVVLDGSWGVLLQNRGLTEEEWRGERFREHARDVKGDPDLLNLTQPEIVESVHRAYFEAGADIATTNTFTATSIGQADYALEASVREMNLEGARLARKVADEHGGFVAGSVGPLNVTLSLSPKVEDPAYRAVRFEDVVESYTEQMVALRDGGVDLLLIETIFDTLNAKAAIAAAREAVPELPLWISFTAIDRSGRNLSGQTVEAFWISVEHARPLIVGRQLLGRRARDAAGDRGALAHRDHVRVVPPERGPAERARHVRRAAGRDQRAPGRVRARKASSTSSAAAAGRPRSTPRRSRPPCRGWRRGRSRSRRAARASAGSSRSRSAPTPAS